MPALGNHTESVILTIVVNIMGKRIVQNDRIRPNLPVHPLHHNPTSLRFPQWRQRRQHIVASIRMDRPLTVGSLTRDPHKPMRRSFHGPMQGARRGRHPRRRSAQGQELPPIPGRPLPRIAIVLRQVKARIITDQRPGLQQVTEFLGRHGGDRVGESLVEGLQLGIGVRGIGGAMDAVVLVQFGKDILSEELLAIGQLNLGSRCGGAQIVTETTEAVVGAIRLPGGRQVLIELVPEYLGSVAGLVNGVSGVGLVKVDGL